MSEWSDWACREAGRIRTAGQWRAVHDVDGPTPPHVSFASNDYLGLRQHPTVVEAARAAVERWGTGAGSARLVAGGLTVHRELESELATWKGAESAVLFSTGYAANLGVLQALGDPSVTVVSDQLNHASIVDGCRLSRAKVVVTPHADVAAMEAAVRAAPGRVVVVTESVFSMDGDLAPMEELQALCEREGALLVVDEAHDVLGPTPHPARSEDVLCVGTLSKALGSLGGFVAGPAELCELIVNRARTFVFTTASTPADTAAALTAVRIVRSPEGAALRARLRDRIEQFRSGHPSPIVPVVLGDESAALAAAAALLEQGLLVPAIRPPTVPPGTSRLRISLTAAHSPEQVDHLLRALADLGDARPAPRVERRPSPATQVLVLGTSTGVGKTWVTVALAHALGDLGYAVAARKPVQSFEPRSGPTDADLLAGATGSAATEVCPAHRWYGAAMAPPLAAEALGVTPFRLADLIAELRWPTTSEADIGLVEGVGGPRSPLAADADNVDLARAVAPDAIVLVADAGLGAINAVLLAVAALPQQPVVFLNRFDAAETVHTSNHEWLDKHGLVVVVDIDQLINELGLRRPSRDHGTEHSTQRA